MLNHVVIMGRMTSDPEIRTMSNADVKYTTFTLACERNNRNSEGKRETDFLECVAFRSTAEFICNNFQKGRLAVAEGRLKIRQWTDRDGATHRNAQIEVENIYFADGFKKPAAAANTQEQKVEEEA